VRICALGDLLLDVIVRPDSPVVAGGDARATSRAGAGGQAANVAAWAVALGADARFVGKRGSDTAGELVASDLAARGVEVQGPVAEGANGVVVSLVDSAGERTMLSDRGVAPDLRPDELDGGWFADCDWLHLTGYSLLRTPIAEAAEAAASLRGGRLSVDLSAWTLIREFGADRLRERLARLEPDLVLGNREEWEAIGPLEPPVRIVKRGARGFTVLDGDGETLVAALDAAVTDSTGAGDALTAGFLVGGAELAREAAARCVARLGAMP
jgi:sugar/nucleoside kinase (ribokinase family)